MFSRYAGGLERRHNGPAVLDVHGKRNRAPARRFLQPGLDDVGVLFVGVRAAGEFAEGVIAHADLHAPKVGRFSGVHLRVVQHAGLAEVVAVRRDHNLAENVAQSAPVEAERRCGQAGDGGVRIVLQDTAVAARRGVVALVNDDELRRRHGAPNKRLDAGDLHRRQRLGRISGHDAAAPETERLQVRRRLVDQFLAVSEPERRQAEVLDYLLRPTAVHPEPQAA